jgi:hypothetical protein
MLFMLCAAIKFIMLRVIMLSVMLNVVMQNVVLLNVVVSRVNLDYKTFFRSEWISYCN